MIKKEAMKNVLALLTVMGMLLLSPLGMFTALILCAVFTPVVGEMIVGFIIKNFFCLFLFIILFAPLSLGIWRK